MPDPTPEVLAIRANAIVNVWLDRLPLTIPLVYLKDLAEGLALALGAYGREQARELERATREAAARILHEEDFSVCPGAQRALRRFADRAAAQGGAND